MQNQYSSFSSTAKNKPNKNPKSKSKDYDSSEETAMIDDVDSDDDIALLADIVSKTDDFYKDYNDNIDRARTYLTFLYVDQWDAKIRKDREDEGKPTMTFNKLTSIIRAALGENRENSPAATIIGVGKNTTQAQVDLYDGLVRQIAYDSDADVVYQIALKSGMETGWGGAIVRQEYENEMSFNKRLRVYAVQDFQQCFWDPLAQETDKSDGDYCGIYTVMSLDKFKKIYPEVQNPVSVTPEGVNYFLPWFTRDSIIIAEIFYKEYRNVDIVQLSDGEVFEKDEAQEIIDKHLLMLKGIPHAELLGLKPLEIVNERTARPYVIKHFKFIQNKILDRTDYPGQILPIPYFEGDSAVVNSTRIPIPFVQDAIDAQKLENYLGSEMAYAMLRARKETVIGSVENFAGYEDEWQNPGQVQGMLPFNPDSDGNKPEFITPTPFNPAYLSLFQSLTGEIYNILGWGEEMRGLQSNAQSGTAIAQRKSASKKPVNVYTDNNARGIKSINRILIDMIPHTYNTEREVMIMSKDGKSKPTLINKNAGFSLDEDGDINDKIENDMKTGAFSIEIRVDGSYDEQQIAAMNCFIQLANTEPRIASLIPDLMAEVSGLENTAKLVERMKTLLPPDILAKESGQPLPPPTQNPQQEMQKMAMQIQQSKMQNDAQKTQIDQQNIILKKQQLALEEQKIMQEGQIAGLDHSASMLKADAEVRKAESARDIAILDHATKVHT